MSSLLLRFVRGYNVNFVTEIVLEECNVYNWSTWGIITKFFDTRGEWICCVFVIKNVGNFKILIYAKCNLWTTLSGRNNFAPQFNNQNSPFSWKSFPPTSMMTRCLKKHNWLSKFYETIFLAPSCHTQSTNNLIIISFFTKSTNP